MTNLKNVSDGIILVSVNFAVVELRIHDNDEMGPHVIQRPAEIAWRDGDLDGAAVEQLLDETSFRLGQTLMKRFKLIPLF